MPELNKSLFTQVKGAVLFNNKLSGGALRFYLRIQYLAGPNTHCWWTQMELAKEFELSEKNGDRTIRRWSKECEKAGILRVERPGYHKANKYYPLAKVPPQVEKLPTEKSELSTPNQPPQTDRTGKTPKDRTGKTGKLHESNYIQHEGGSTPFYRPNPCTINWKNWGKGGKNAHLVAIGAS